MRPPHSIRRLVRLPVLAAAVALTLAAPTPTRAQLIAPTSDAEAWRLLDGALTGLAQASLQQLDPALWTDVRPTARAALEAARAARDSGAPDDVCLAAQRTLQAILDRHDLIAPEAGGGDAGGALSSERIIDDLLFAEGRLVETSLLLSEMLFELERDQEGADVLRRGVVLWPGDARLHDSIRAWRFVLPNPEELINPLQDRADSLGLSQPLVAGQCLETAGMLHGVLGTRAYETRDFAVAGLHFDASNRDLLRAESMPRGLAEEHMTAMRGDASVNAAMSFLGMAQEIWFADRSDRKQSVDAMMAAEESITAAMRLRPEHEPTLNAVLFIGETWKDKADVDQVTDADLADSREFFYRMAQRFEVADWWNNYAFWCRETALAAEAAGKKEEAMELFERSYAGYEKTIELAPDNSRYVNDTGLILLYYLHRDLDRAEELFMRSWELGRAVYDNPFAEDDVRAENLSAFGDAMLNLAILYLERGEAERAKELNDQLLELSPERVDAMALERRIEAAL